MSRDEQIRELLEKAKEQARIRRDAKIFNLMCEALAKLEEQPENHYLPKECPEGGEHHWRSRCSKCDMTISCGLKEHL